MCIIQHNNGNLKSSRPREFSGHQNHGRITARKLFDLSLPTSYGSFTLHENGPVNATGNKIGSGVCCSHCSHQEQENIIEM